MRSHIVRSLVVAAVVVATALGQVPTPRLPGQLLPDPSPARVAGTRRLRTSWQWELSVVPTAREISRARYGMWDIDGFDNSAATITAIHAHSKVVCYLSAGSYEGWRPDAAQLPRCRAAQRPDAAARDPRDPRLEAGRLGRALARHP